VQAPWIPYSKPYRAPHESKYPEEVLNSGHTHGDGPFTEKASELLADITACHSVLLTGSGTHALELASWLLELGPGDEVIVPSFTFSTTAASVVMTGATPVFVDIDPATGSLDIEAALTRSPRSRPCTSSTAISCGLSGDLPLRRRRRASRRIEDRVARVIRSLDSLVNSGWTSPVEDDSGVRHCTGPDGSHVSYPEGGLDVLGLDGGHGFWFDHRFEAVLDLLKQGGLTSIWDIGAGTGSMASRLSQAGIDVVAVEPFKTGAEASARQGVTSFCGTLQDLQLPDACLPAIGMFDVLEHLEHPEELLKEAHRVLQPDGILLVTVPALKWLWGDEDDVAGHYRRYRKPSLDATICATAFSPLASRYLFASLVPAAALLRALPYRLGRRKSEADVLANMKRQLNTPASVDRGMRLLMRAEKAFSKTIPLPAGLSIVAAFRRVDI